MLIPHDHDGKQAGSRSPSAGGSLGSGHYCGVNDETLQERAEGARMIAAQRAVQGPSPRERAPSWHRQGETESARFG